MKGVKVILTDPATLPPVAPVLYRPGKQKKVVRLGDPCGLTDQWREVLRRDPCPYCRRRKPEELMNVEHVEPRTAGGEQGFTNTVGACAVCNTAKSDKPLLLHLLELRPEVAA